MMRYSAVPTIRMRLLPDDNTLTVYSHEGEADFTVHQFVNIYIKIVPTSSKDTLAYDSITYTFEHCTVRGSSEYQLGASQSQLEIQSFFKSADNLYAIISHLIDPPNVTGGQVDFTFVDNLADEPRLKTLGGNYPSTDTQLDFLGQGMTAFRELTDAYFYKYDGSISYPPCTQSGIK